jgi:GcrA cell cycle regulator
MNWDDEALTVLKTMLSQGCRYSLIAERLNVSRNAIVGKVHRLGIAPERKLPAPKLVRKTDRASAAEAAHKVKRAQKRRRHHANHPAAPAPALPMKPMMETKAKAACGLLDLRVGMCKWPFGDPRDPGFHFCGGQCNEEKPYCPEHHARAHI